MFFFDRKIHTTVIDINTKKTKTFKELYTVIDVNKSNSSAPNEGKIEIYNLNSDSENICQKENNLVIIAAGYGTEIKQIYSGTIKRGITQKKGPDSITSMTLYDGINIYKNTKVSKSFVENTTGKQIIDFLINEMNLTIGSYKDIPDIKYNNGFAASGFARDVLTTVTKKMGLKWYIQDGELYIHGKNNNNGQTAFRLTYNSGLIQIPEPLGIGLDQGKGYQLTCLLNPEFKVGRPVVVDTKQLQGTFRINSINFKGNNEKGDFNAILKVQ